MKKVKYIFSMVSMMLVLASCTVTVPYAVTDAPVGSKKGSSKTAVLFGSIQLNGNYGIKEAAKKGKIKGPISTVDIRYKTYGIGIFYHTKELLVTGHSE